MRGCAGAVNENESHYRPPSKDHATFTFGFSGEKQKLVGKNCDKLPKNN
tara:strand:+ start:470 stop:616 length:147 start_codon:yes stop_codon:yes gene_type:complete